MRPTRVIAPQVGVETGGWLTWLWRVAGSASRLADRQAGARWPCSPADQPLTLLLLVEPLDHELLEEGLIAFMAPRRQRLDALQRRVIEPHRDGARARPRRRELVLRNRG